MVLWCMNKMKMCIQRYNNMQLVLFSILELGLLFGCRTPQTAENEGATPPPTAPPTATPVQLADLTFATLAPPTIEVIQQTPTPLPTATSTPTATPIVYAIQDGDTLLAIAIDNQTTVEEIQTLNPGVRPELLSIGQEITLPPPATPVFSSERPTPLPVQVEVVSTSLFPDGAGGLWVLGEMKNSSDYFLENLQLEITLYGAGGLAVGQAKTWGAAPLVAAGDTTPFGVLFPQKPDGNLQAEIDVASGFVLPDLPSGRDYFGLTADEPQWRSEGETLEISGTLSNSGGQTAVDAVGLLLAYDSSNRLIGYSQHRFPPSLPAGESVAYATTFVPLGGEVSKVRIQIYAKGKSD